MKPILQPGVKPDDQGMVTADYLAGISGSLCELARRNGYDTLGYLFELAKLEAENLQRRVGDSAPADFKCR